MTAPEVTMARPVPGSGFVADCQRTKKPRKSRPKVKTGCNNCKQRRIKCDEARPACSACVRSKKECAGYPPPPRPRPSEEIRIAPKPMQPQRGEPPWKRLPIQLPPRRPVKRQYRTTPPLTPVLRQPSMRLPFSVQEGQYFQLFREQTANELSGFFDSVFWSRTVLQECQAEPAIRHAVIAMGALYKTLEKSSESPPSSPAEYFNPVDSPIAHWQTAVAQYSGACNALVGANAEDCRSHRMRLVASVLLACFDSFVGDHQQAIRQIQTGLGLLEQLRAERRRAFRPRPDEPVEEEIIQMFTRLAIQAKSYDMAFHFPDPYVIRLTAPPRSSDAPSPASDAASPASLHSDGPIPQDFASLIEARLSWDTLCERIFRFIETMFEYACSKPTGVLPSSLRQHGAAFKHQIELWSAAFEPILQSRKAPRVSSQEKAGIAVLKMFQIMSWVLFMMTFQDNEMQFDNYRSLFREIVDYALEVVGDEESRARARRCLEHAVCPHTYGSGRDHMGDYEYTAPHIKPSFSADLGIVPPLYVVATKCRDPWLRRQAMQLLKSSARREGMWDSELAARIAGWITEVEEEEEAAMLAPPSPDEMPGVKMGPQTGPPGFGVMAMGSWGNARRDRRTESHMSAKTQLRPPVVPEENRVMVRTVEFDLRERFAVVRLGTRGLSLATPDMKTQINRITW